MASLILCSPMIIVLLLAPMLLPISAAPPPTPPEGCSDHVLALSPCLPYISDPPNNLSSLPSSQCCDVFNSTFSSSEDGCLCYLVRRPSLLGFPLNKTRVFSLSVTCPSRDERTANSSLRFLCSGLTVLPPLQSATGSSIFRPPPILSLPLETRANESLAPGPSHDSQTQPISPPNDDSETQPISSIPFSSEVPSMATTTTVQVFKSCSFYSFGIMFFISHIISQV